MAAKLEQTPTILNITAVVDDDFTWTAFFEEELSPGVFTPITLTGLVIDAMITKKETDEVPLENFNTDPDNPSAGYLVLSLDEAETKALGRGTYFYSVRLTRSGYTRTYLSGTFTLERKASYD